MKGRDRVYITDGNVQVVRKKLTGGHLKIEEAVLVASKVYQEMTLGPKWNLVTFLFFWAKTQNFWQANVALLVTFSAVHMVDLPTIQGVFTSVNSLAQHHLCCYHKTPGFTVLCSIVEFSTIMSNFYKVIFKDVLILKYSVFRQVLFAFSYQLLDSFSSRSCGVVVRD